jgi:YebC/PmpR family DNA-binding regulatory protein
MEELAYEGYAPGGIALIVTALTDNRSRTAADLKHLFDKRGGNLGSPGSVAFLFQFRSILVVESAGRSEDQLLELALEVGADDVQWGADESTILADPTAFLPVKSALEARGLAFVSAELGYVPLTTTKLATLDDAKKLVRLVDELEALDDVQAVYGNHEIEASWLEQL